MAEPLWRRYLRLVRPDVRADVDDEVRFHLESRIRDLEASGLDRAAAERVALERFGDVERVRAWLHRHDRRRDRAAGRRARRLLWRHHLKVALRGLVRAPAFTVATVLTLALGIGATSAIVAVVDGVLVRPLPYPESDRLVTIWHHTAGSSADFPMSQALYATYRRFGGSLAGIGVHAETAVNLTGNGVPERVPADSLTASLFDVLGVTPLAGRLFGPADEVRGGPPVVVIGERLWTARFGRSPRAIGSRLRIDDVEHEVIGVVPERTSFPSAATQLWFPIRFDPEVRIPIGFGYSAVGRLRPGQTATAAARDLQAVLPRVEELFAVAVPGLSMADWVQFVKPRVVLHSLRDDVIGDVGRMLWIITATSLFVLLAAAANIANLFLARAEARKRELAVHGALGASRADVAARFLAETLVVSAAGAAAGAMLAALGVAWIKRAGGLDIPRLAEVQWAGRALVDTALIALGVAFVTAVFPILKLRDVDPAAVLRTSERGAGAGRDRRRVQRGLVVTQVALAYVLLTACVLLGRSFLALRQVPLGFTPDQVLGFRVALPRASYPDLGSATRFFTEVEQRLRALPGVTAVGFAEHLPLEAGRRNSTTIAAEGDIEPEERALAARTVMVASKGFFEGLGIRRLAGRWFPPAVGDAGATEAVVNAAYARAVWGDSTGERALGRRLQFLPGTPALTVVGVAADFRDESLERAAPPTLYLPLNTAGWQGTLDVVPRSLGVAVRVAGNPDVLRSAVVRAVASIDPMLPLYDLRPLRETIRDSMARTTMTALLLGVAAAVALALGIVGLFGIVAYAVGRRRREIGLRVALGAPPGQVVRGLALNGARLALTGIGLGILGALALARGLQALLFDVAATDPVSLVGVGCLLLGAATVASWIPAHRAGRIDPASVLRAE